MMVSSACSSGASVAIVSSTNAAGTMMQMQRGGASAATNSSSEPRARAPLAHEPGDRVGAHVEDDAVVAAAHQAPHHVGAHAPQSDHAQPAWRLLLTRSWSAATLAPGRRREGSSGDNPVTEGERAWPYGRAPLNPSPWRRSVRSRHLVPLVVVVLAVPRRRRLGVGWSPSGVVISKLRLRTAASQFDEYVEIQNTSSATVDLSGLAAVRLLHLGRHAARGHRRRSAGRRHEAARRADLRLRQERGRLHGHRRCRPTTSRSPRPAAS